MTTIEKTISKYFKNEKDIIAVYLFGSYAANRQRAMSDVDIGLVADFDKIGNVAEKRKRFEIELSRMLRKDIHLVLLNTATEELLAQVFKKGKCVLSGRPKDLAAFKMNRFARIADFGYYKKMLQRGFVDKVMES